MKSRALFSLIAVICGLFSSMALANTYSNCKVDNVLTQEAVPNLVTVTVSCTAPDAFTSGPNCAGTIKSNAFIFDSSTVTGKSHMALLLTAMAAGNNIYANTYGSCPAGSPDTLWLYSLKVFRQ